MASPVVRTKYHTNKKKSRRIYNIFIHLKELISTVQDLMGTTVKNMGDIVKLTFSIELIHFVETFLFTGKQYRFA